MDFTFLLVTIFLILFLIISYYLDVIKLSSPLLLIYLIFCFSYVVDKELVSKADYELKNEKDIENSEKVLDFANTSDAKTELIDKNNNQKFDVSKPIVSFNPKPIIIDSNLIIQKIEIKIWFLNLILRK